MDVDEAARGREREERRGREAGKQEQRLPVPQRPQGEAELLAGDHARQGSARHGVDRVRGEPLGGEQVEGDPLDPGDVGAQVRAVDVDPPPHGAFRRSAATKYRQRRTNSGMVRPSTICLARRSRRTIRGEPACTVPRAPR